jgi:predicted DNA-binding transcriptional regulator AlpA
MGDVSSFDRLWTVDDLSEFLGIAVHTIRGWRCKNYGPPARKIGKHLRYDPAEVREWFANLGKGNAA